MHHCSSTPSTPGVILKSFLLGFMALWRPPHVPGIVWSTFLMWTLDLTIRHTSIALTFFCFQNYLPATAHNVVRVRGGGGWGPGGLCLIKPHKHNALHTKLRLHYSQLFHRNHFSLCVQLFWAVRLMRHQHLEITRS